MGAEAAEAGLVVWSGSLMGCWGDGEGAGDEEGEADGWMGEGPPLIRAAGGRDHAETGALVAAVSPLVP